MFLPSETLLQQRWPLCRSSLLAHCTAEAPVRKQLVSCCNGESLGTCTEQSKRPLASVNICPIIASLQLRCQNKYPRSPQGMYDRMPSTQSISLLDENHDLLFYQRITQGSSLFYLQTRRRVYGKLAEDKFICLFLKNRTLLH